MTIFTESHGRLANKSYAPHDGRIDTNIFLLIREVDQASGYRGMIYRNNTTGDYVVTHTGTEFDVDRFRDLMVTDAQMALLKINQQLDDARAAVELAIAMAKRDGTSVTVTGHSLGGFHTQVTCHEYRLSGETFNAYGAAGLYDVPTGGNLVVNHVRVSDMVGAANRHFGEVRLYATQQDVEMLLMDGTPPSQQNRLELINDLRRMGPDLTHGAVQFHGGQRKPEELAIFGPNSIATQENHALYQQHRTEFDAYREDIRQTSRDLATLFKTTGVGMIYSAAVGSQHLGHGIRRHVLGDDVRDEIRELRQDAQRTIAEANRDFVVPSEPLIRRNGPGNDFEDMREKLEKTHRKPTLDDTYCKPDPSSGWPTHPASASSPEASPPLSLRDDPLAYVNRMIAAYDAGDLDTFRQMTQAAASDPVGRQMQAQAAARVDQEEQQQAQKLAEQQRQEQGYRHSAVAMHGPRLH
jgi:hypothetical protein